MPHAPIRGGLVPTFEQLAAVSLARGDLERDDVALRLVQELDWDADRGRHGRYVNVNRTPLFDLRLRQQKRTYRRGPGGSGSVC